MDGLDLMRAGPGNGLSESDFTDLVAVEENLGVLVRPA